MIAEISLRSGPSAPVTAVMVALGLSSGSALGPGLAWLPGGPIPRYSFDLIYGLPGQTVGSWLRSLNAALSFAPEELYLYPLYVRPLTGLDRLGAPAWDDLRLACYRTGRDLLRASGYEQISMRMFRRSGTPAAPR